LIRLTWRFLLTCFLVVALSLQGIAQASVITCEQDHPGHGFLTELAPDGVQALAGHADQGHHHAVSSKNTKPIKDKCNHCAPCCTGAAILSDSVFQIVAPEVAQHFPALIVAEYSTDRGLLDRPPQAFLA